MKITGTEKELREHFKARKIIHLPRFESKIKVTNRMLYSLVWAGVLLIVFTIIYAIINNNYVTEAQCNAKISAAVMLNSLTMDLSWDKILKFWAIQRGGMIITLVGIAWIIHGVGFHLIKR
jgi:hypothetical protein